MIICILLLTFEASKLKQIAPTALILAALNVATNRKLLWSFVGGVVIIHGNIRTNKTKKHQRCLLFVAIV